MQRAAIFDLDGTLVDLFDVHLGAFQKIIRRDYGLEFTADDLLRGYGEKGEDIARMFFEKYDVTGVDYEKFAKERAEIAEKGAGAAKPLPGVLALLKELKGRGVKIALATSCRKSLAEKIIGAMEIKDYFDAIITAEDVTDGKPNPEIFLKAADGLGMKPGECVVFEDPLYGVRAAKRAGMKVAAVTTGGRSRDELMGGKPDIVVDTLEDAESNALF